MTQDTTKLEKCAREWRRIVDVTKFCLQEKFDLTIIFHFNSHRVAVIRMRLLWNSITSPDVLSKLQEGTFYLVVNGKVANSLTQIVDFDNVEVVPRALGGKGGL
jgi:hypothetical protein